MNHSKAQLFPVLSAGVVCLLLFIAGIWNRLSDRQGMRHLLFPTIREEQNLPLLFYREQADVMGKVYDVNATQLFTPDFIDGLSDLTGLPSGLLLITQDAITAALLRLDVAAELVITGSMDNESLLAYIVTPE